MGTRGGAGALALVAALLVVAPSGARATSIPFEIDVAKHRDGPYRAQIKANMAGGATRTFWWRVTSDDPNQQQMVFDDAGTSDQDGYRTRWFKGGDDITRKVEGDGKRFRLDPGERDFFNAKQKAPESPPPSCLAGQAGIEDFVFTRAPIAINGGSCP